MTAAKFTQRFTLIPEHFNPQLFNHVTDCSSKDNQHQLTDVTYLVTGSVNKIQIRSSLPIRYVYERLLGSFILIARPYLKD